MNETPVRNANWMTAAEVAQALDCSERTVWKWADQGLIPKPVRRPRSSRWRRSEIENYVQTGEVPDA